MAEGELLPGPLIQPPAVAARAGALAFAGAIVLGTFLRARAPAIADFPLNDGGLFFRMIEDLRAAGHLLPAFTTYNDGAIPFAYPPLAFYVGSVASQVVGTSEALRILPALASALTLVPFALLAGATLRSRVAAVAATFAYAVVPNGFLWMVMGGGLTRALGLLFAVIGIQQLHRYYTTADRRSAAAASLAGALALLTHIEMAWFLAFTGALFLAAYGRRRQAVVGTAAIGAAALVAAAPWWVTTLVRHGPGPFVAAAQTGSLANPIETLLRFRETGEPMFTLISALAVLGVVVALLRGRVVLVAWLVLVGLLDARSLGPVGAVPMALLAGVAIRDVFVPLTAAARPAVRPLLATATIAYAAWGALQAAPELTTPLSRDERAAMAYVARETPADARFAVITEWDWAADRASEWFPTLTRRVSVATVQGQEWSGDRGFWRQLERFDALQECASREAACLARWGSANRVAFDHVYVSKRSSVTYTDGPERWCCGVIRQALLASAEYALVYDGPGATIFRRR